MNFNDNYMKFVGWTETPASRAFFSDETICHIQREIKSRTGITVNPENIKDNLNNIYENYRPPVGDMYSRNWMPSEYTGTDAFTQSMQLTIDSFCKTIEDEREITQNNQKLSAWVQMYGNFNEHGLRAHSVIKTREKRPTPMQFYMRY